MTIESVGTIEIGPLLGRPRKLGRPMRTRSLDHLPAELLRGSRLYSQPRAYLLHDRSKGSVDVCPLHGGGSVLINRNCCTVVHVEVRGTELNKLMISGAGILIAARLL